MKKITASVLLIVLLVLPVTGLFSCGKKAQETDNTPSEAAPVAAEGESNTVERLLPAVPDANFEEHEFSYLVQNITWGGDELQNHRDLVAEQENGEGINDAVYRRNQRVMEKYNISFKQGQADDEKIIDLVKKLVNAGDTTYDIIYPSMRNSATLVSGGFLADLNELQYVDFTKPWWDADSYNALSINRKNYILNNSISITDIQGANALVFNKKLFAENALENPYQIVLDGKWTLDKFGEMIKKVSRDLDGDGLMDEKDQWGMMFARDTLSSFCNGSNVFIAGKDADDMPVITFMGDYQVQVYNKIFDILYDKSSCFNYHIAFAASTNVYEDMNKMFQNNQSVFLWIRMRDCERFRTMETDFGILPTPKFDEKQENYISTINPWTSSIMAMPVTNTDFVMTGAVIESLAADAYYTLRPVYYDVMLNTKIARDTDSSAMLDIIFNGRGYDIGDIFQFGGLAEYIHETTTYKRDMVSFYEKNEGKAQKDLEKFIEQVQK